MRPNRAELQMKIIQAEDSDQERGSMLDDSADGSKKGDEEGDGVSNEEQELEHLNHLESELGEREAYK